MGYGQKQLKASFFMAKEGFQTTAPKPKQVPVGTDRRSIDPIPEAK